MATLERDDVQQQCAWAKNELAKLTAARKAKVNGAEKLDLKEFEAQPKACQTEVVAYQLRVTERAKRASAQKAQWEARKTSLAQKTFDARASPYVE
jgi:hypothetical protein